MTAQDVQVLLQAKHANDVYVAECKNGPSYGGLSILDGWAMKKSWARPLVTGYEIKVSRSDFLRDNKYTHYANYCNCMYIVAPAGVLVLEELPEGIGYYQVASTGTRLICKHKAPRRDEPIPEEIYRYILMARVKIVPSHQVYFDEGTKKQFFESWLKEREVNRALGRRVSQALRTAIEQRIENVELENKRLSRENEKLAEVKKVMGELGVNPSSWHVPDEFRRKFDEKINGERKQLSFEIGQGLRALRFLEQQVKAT